jgi:hypothetical protein
VDSVNRQFAKRQAALATAASFSFGRSMPSGGSHGAPKNRRHLH